MLTGDAPVGNLTPADPAYKVRESELVMVESEFLKAAEQAVKEASKETKKRDKPKTDLSGIVDPIAQPVPPAPVVQQAQQGTQQASASGSLLALVERGRKFEPPRILLYGVDGVGKSSWAAQAPNPVFIQTEDGLGQIDCAKFPLATKFRDVIAQLQTLATEKHDFETVVIDSLDWLERLIWDAVCERTNAPNIEKVGGGFAKGYTFSLDEWRQVIDLLKVCRARGMVVILIAHAKIERFEDPKGPAFDRYSPRLNKHAEALIREWVDTTLFANKRLMVKKEGEGFNERHFAQAVGASGGERVLTCESEPGTVAKNRYDLPSEVPMPKGEGWKVFLGYISNFMKG